MRSIALFILFSLIFYSTYFVMNEKLRETEPEVTIKYKEVPKQILEEQYTFNNTKYFEDIKQSENLWKKVSVED
jgi:hypothetical protein